MLLLFFLCELDLELEEVEISSELVLTGFCCLTTKTAIMTTRMASKMPNAKRKSFFCLLTGFFGGGHWGYRAPALWPFRPPWAPKETSEKARLLRSPAAGLTAF